MGKRKFLLKVWIQFSPKIKKISGKFKKIIGLKNLGYFQGNSRFFSENSRFLRKFKIISGKFKIHLKNSRFFSGNSRLFSKFSWVFRKESFKYSQKKFNFHWKLLKKSSKNFSENRVFLRKFYVFLEISVIFQDFIKNPQNNNFLTLFLIFPFQCQPEAHPCPPADIERLREIEAGGGQQISSFAGTHVC